MKTQKQVEEWFGLNYFKDTDLLKVLDLISDKIDIKALDLAWAYIGKDSFVHPKLVGTFDEFYHWWVGSDNKPDNLTIGTVEGLIEAFEELYAAIESIHSSLQSTHSSLQNKYAMQGVDELFQQVRDVIANSPKPEPNYYPTPERWVELDVKKASKLSGKELSEREEEMIRYTVELIYKLALTETEYLYGVSLLHDKLFNLLSPVSPVAEIMDNNCKPLASDKGAQKRAHETIMSAMDEVKAKGGARWTRLNNSTLLDDLEEVIKTLRDKTKTAFPSHLDGSIYDNATWVSGAKFALHLIEDVVNKRKNHDV